MSDGTLHHDEAGHHHPLMPVAALLRVIDGGVALLQRMRNRIETPAVDEDDMDRGRRRARVAEEPAAAASAAPPPGLLRRVLVVTMCLLLGVAAGMMVSYRGFSNMVKARDAMIAFMQDEIEQSKKAEAQSLDARVRYQNEALEYRKQLRESQQLAEDYRVQLDELNDKLAAKKAPSVARPGVPAVASRQPPKTGTCVTGAANLVGNVADCIEKFNRP